jgi:hypothetical protein
MIDIINIINPFIIGFNISSNKEFENVLIIREFKIIERNERNEIRENSHKNAIIDMNFEFLGNIIEEIENIIKIFRINEMLTDGNKFVAIEFFSFSVLMKESVKNIIRLRFNIKL